MMDAALAVQSAIYQALSASNSLAGLVGSRIFDVVPDDAEFPHVVFGDATISDWSTGTEPGLEHDFTVNVWSEQHGRKEAILIAAAVLEAVQQVQTVNGWVLVNLRHQFTECKRDRKNGLFQASLNFRAVTEPAT